MLLAVSRESLRCRRVLLRCSTLPSADRTSSNALETCVPTTASSPSVAFLPRLRLHPPQRPQTAAFRVLSCILISFIFIYPTYANTRLSPYSHLTLPVLSYLHTTHPYRLQGKPPPPVSVFARCHHLRATVGSTPYPVSYLKSTTLHHTPSLTLYSFSLVYNSCLHQNIAKPSLRVQTPPE